MYWVTYVKRSEFAQWTNLIIVCHASEIAESFKSPGRRTIISARCFDISLLPNIFLEKIKRSFWWSDLTNFHLRFKMLYLIHLTFLFMRYWQFTIAVIPCNSQTSRILATTCSSTSNFKPSLSRLSDEAEIHKMPLGKKSSKTCDYLAKMRGQLRELGHLLWRPSNL